MKKIMLSMLAILLLAGCGTFKLAPAGAYTDSVTYGADLSITTSYDVLHAFVKWEHDNAAALAGTPEIHAAANNIRKNAKQWIGSAIALRDAYAASPTAGNKSSLQTGLEVLSAAVAQATTYLVQSTATPLK